MCAPHPIDPSHLLAPIETAVPPEAETSNTETQRRKDAELAALADEMHRKCQELMGGLKLGPGAAGLLVDAWADRIERALGIQPEPSRKVREVREDAPPQVEPVYFTPDAVLRNPPFAPETETQRRKDAEPISRVEAIQILSRGLAYADRRTRSAHLMAIHSLAKRGAEQMRYARRKALQASETPGSESKEKEA